MIFEVILDFMKNLRLRNVNIHRKFEQNRLINECVRKKKAKIPKSQNPGITKTRNFLVRYKRTYVLKNYLPMYKETQHIPYPIPENIYS